MRRCQVLNLGLVEYGKTWEIQKDLFHARSLDRVIDTLLLLQHPLTYTFGRRSQPGQPVFDEEGPDGPAIYRVDRGGGATCHGPGQIVGYPIIGLKDYTTDLHAYLRMLEEVMMGALKDFQIESQRLKGYTGVWMEGEKIGSIGVRVIRGVTMHGFSLNVNNDLAPFDKIVPCNIRGVRMTSMSRILRTELIMSEVEEGVTDHFARVFDVIMERVSNSSERQNFTVG